jgi:hypothetical protein
VKWTLYPNQVWSRFLGFWVIGGTNDPFVFTGLRTCPPFGLPTREVVILLPNLLQELHAGHLLQLGWGIGLLQRLQQMQPICSDLLRQAPLWSVPIACDSIKKQRKEVLSKFLLSSQHDALEYLSAVSEAYCIFIESLSL